MNKLLLTAVTLAALAVPATAAQAATPLAQVAADAESGMTYFGTSSNDTVTFALVAGGSKILVDNVAPLKANAGCLPVAGDTTRATCTVFRTASGVRLPINAFGVDGPDKITNTSQIGMIAAGGNGQDKLVGALGNDKLFGEGGDFDSVQGGGGNDILSGGAGAHDLATYSDKASGVFATIKDGVNSVGNGVLGENDQINADIEDLGGGIAGDFLTGNSIGNVLAGGIGNDTLQGNRGADQLVGGDGDDILLSNAELFGPLFDGAADSLNGSAGQDACGGAPSECDTKTKCEF